MAALHALEKRLGDIRACSSTLAAKWKIKSGERKIEDDQFEQDLSTINTREDAALTLRRQLLRQGSLDPVEVDRELDKIQAAEKELLERRNLMLAERSLEDVQKDADLHDMESQEDEVLHRKRILLRQRLGNGASARDAPIAAASRSQTSLRCDNPASPMMGTAVLAPVLTEVTAPTNSERVASQAAIEQPIAQKGASAELSIASALAGSSVASPGSVARLFSALTAGLLLSDVTPFALPLELTTVSNISSEDSFTSAYSGSTCTSSYTDPVGPASIRDGPTNVLTRRQTARMNGGYVSDPKHPATFDDQDVDVFDTLVNSVEASLDTASTVQQQHNGSPFHADGADLEDDEIQMMSVRATEKPDTNTGRFKLPIDLHSGGRQNNFPVKFKHGRHIYYRISNQQFVILVCPVPKCRQTTFGTISDLLDHLKHNHFAYHNDVLIRNYEDALDAFGREVEGIGEDQSIKVESGEDRAAARGCGHRAPAESLNAVDNFPPVAFFGELPYLHQSDEDLPGTSMRIQQSKRRRARSSADEPMTGRKRQRLPRYYEVERFLR